MNRLSILTVILFMTVSGSSLAKDAVFVGSKACRDCHEKKYASYMQYSKKARSFSSVKKMEKKLTPKEYASCFECHTTGYGQKGGFVSETRTPELKDAGCEACHGPGSLHVESGDPDQIQGQISVDLCNTCHDSSRIAAFNYTPLMFGGAH